jgi:chitinase
MSRVAFEKITHLNLAFINPDSLGNFRFPAELDTIISKAHDHNVKVLASLGGGNSPAYFKMLLDDVHRPALVNNIIAFTLQHQLDGIDVDLEGQAIDEHYETFVSELSRSLKKQDKLLTAALATVYGPTVSKKALDKFDFINIMSYDKTGPWNPNHPGQHSPLVMAETDLQYWTIEKGIRKKKLILGVPFYGYLFGKQAITALSYADITTRFPGAEKQDSTILADGSLVYYNGAETIRLKTKLAMEKAGGIMFWQILQDADGTMSLLNRIAETIKERKR